MPRTGYYYDPHRPAIDGHWVVLQKGNSIVHCETYKTEAEARKALGLKGGSTNPHYIPDDAA